MKLVSAIVHYEHCIFVYENDEKLRSYKLFDASAKFVKEFPITLDEGKHIAGDVGAAMRLAKASTLQAEAQELLDSATAS